MNLVGNITRIRIQERNSTDKEICGSLRINSVVVSLNRSIGIDERII